MEEGGSEGEDSGWETASEEDEEVAGQAQQLAAATARLALGGSRAARATRAAVAAAVRGDGSGAAEAEGTSGSGGEEEGEEGDWEEWDVRRSLFDNRMAASMEENLEYMFKQYGFYLPDAEYLVDPEGLLKYLGSKLQYGKVRCVGSGRAFVGNMPVVCLLWRTSSGGLRASGPLMDQ